MTSPIRLHPAANAALTLTASVALAAGQAMAAPAPQHDHAAHAQHTAPAQDAHPAAPTHHATHMQDGTHAAMHAQHHGTVVSAGHVRWAPDPPLQQGMRRMRDALAGLAHHEMGHLDETQVDNLATEVDEAAAFMFANCKLEPEPDVALHGVLARLMAGAEALHAAPADPTPVADMRAALEDYTKLFDDPALFAPADDEH